MKYTPEQRKQISEIAKGKVIESMEWIDSTDGYWVITFQGGYKMGVRLISEVR